MNITNAHKGALMAVVGKLMILNNVDQKTTQDQQYWHQIVTMLQAEGIDGKDADWMALTYITAGLTLVAR